MLSASRARQVPHVSSLRPFGALRCYCSVPALNQTAESSDTSSLSEQQLLHLGVTDVINTNGSVKVTWSDGLSHSLYVHHCVYDWSLYLT